VTVISSLTSQSLMRPHRNVEQEKNTRAATSNKRGKRNVNCLEAPLETLTGTDKDMEEETVSLTNDSVRVQRNVCSHNDKHPPVHITRRGLILKLVLEYSRQLPLGIH